LALGLEVFWEVIGKGSESGLERVTETTKYNSANLLDAH
jgi:hypothetical protein